MNELIPVIEKDNGEIAVSGREVHGFLEVGTPYAKWITRMFGYGFEENLDYFTVGQKCPIANGGYQERIDHAITLDMAKELCMIQRNEKGKQARKYFIEIEKAWNDPVLIMGRALEMQKKKVAELVLDNSQKAQRIEEQEATLTAQAPKVNFANAVSGSETSILVRELAKLITQNGVNIGEKRLFEWMRINGYLIRRKGADYNSPTQRSMNQGLFEVKETVSFSPYGQVITNRTPLVTGKGQLYFIQKFTLGRYVKEMDIQERKTRTGSYTRYVIKLTERQYKFLLGELEVVHAYEAIDFMQKFFVDDVVTEAVVNKTTQKMTALSA